MRTFFLASTIAVLGLAGTAQAHFDLIVPPSISRATEDIGKGNPPCGPDTSTTSAPVMTYKPGDTVTVTFKESTPHPGWYRVLLAKNGPSELPADPMVTPGASPCGTVNYTAGTIVGLTPTTNPVFPLLADGMLVHTKPFSGNQTFTFKLPNDVTCTRCTLEVEEFMSDHGLNGAAGCFYHHCAAITIAGATIDAGASDAIVPNDAKTDGAAAGSTGSTGAAGAGAGGATGIGGTGGTPTTGTAGAGGSSATGAAGSTTGAAGVTGAAGSTTGSAGSTGASGATGGRSSGGGGCTLSGSSTSRGGVLGATVLLGLVCLARRKRRS